MKGNERRVRIGGLLRCCIETIETIENETDVGDVYPCAICKDKSSVRVANDGVWEWNHDIETALR